jgi:hypothetical protein
MDKNMGKFKRSAEWAPWWTLFEEWKAVRNGGRSSGKPSEGTWLVMESMTGFHCHQSLLQSRVTEPQQGGSLWQLSGGSCFVHNLPEIWVGWPLLYRRRMRGKVWAWQVQWDGKVDTAQVCWQLQPTPVCETLWESKDTNSSEPR